MRKIQLLQAVTMGRVLETHHPASFRLTMNPGCISSHNRNNIFSTLIQALTPYDVRSKPNHQTHKTCAFLGLVLTYGITHGTKNIKSCDENYALLRYNATSSGNPLPTFRDNVSVPPSRVGKSSWHLKMGPVCCPETSVTNEHSTQEHRSHQYRAGSLKSQNACDVTFVCGVLTASRVIASILSRSQNYEKWQLASSRLPVSLFTRSEKLGSHSMDFYEIWYLRIF
jgi:hypothetical protein